MSSSKNPSSAPNEDDPWEQLADQFGLESGKEKEYASREPSPSAPEPAPLSEAESESPSSRSRREVPYQAESSVEEPPRFASEAVESPEPEFGESAESPDSGSRGISEDVTPAIDGGLEPAAATPTSPQDSYWDALANWNWDESEGGGGKARSEPSQPAPRRADEGRAGGGPPQRGGPRGRDEGRGRRGGDRPSRQQSSSPPPAGDRPAPQPSRSSPPGESSEGDDFGLGLEGPEFNPRVETPAVERRPAQDVSDEARELPAATPPAQSESPGGRGDFHGAQRGGRRPGEQGPHGGGEGDIPRKRRRRRRRRRGGRGGEGEAGGQTSAASSAGSEWDDSAGPEAVESETADDSAEPGEFAADHPPAEARAGRRRDREEDGSRAEQSTRGFDDEDEPDEVFQAGGEPGEADFDVESDDDVGEEQTVSYENVPTWEEAISYLLHPSQVQVESGGGGGNPPRGAAPADQPRQTRHIGHRKHRR